MSDEILSGDASREGVAARGEIRAALRSVYSAADVAAWLGEKTKPRRRELVALTIHEPELAMVFSLWRGAIKRDVEQRTMRDIAYEIAVAYEVTLDDLIGDAKTRDYSIPRQHAMWAMCQQGRWSRTVIGKFLGGRDHTTVLHGERAHIARVAAGWLEREAA